MASSFALMKLPGCDILSNFEKTEYKRFRSRIIGHVLATDMAKHFSELGKFKSRIGAEDFDPKGNDKEALLNMMFHLADISNPTKPWELCRKWTDLLFAEFFHQGDMERQRGVPISYLMDRTSVNTAKSQIGFLDVIISPAYEAAKQVLPEIEVNTANIASNKEEWAKYFDEYEKVMEEDKARI